MPDEENKDTNSTSKSSKPVKASDSKASEKLSAKSPKKARTKKSDFGDLAKLLEAIDKDEQVINYRSNVKAIVSRLHEHLSCFILIGYTEDGSPVHITQAGTPKDYDALSTGLQKYVLDTLPKGPPGSYT